MEKEKNSSFNFTIESDNENRITHCFWVDATSRRGYNFLCDVVVFYTTYNTNKYGMIFAPFIRVSNHGQTTVFTCSFLSNETTESFVWLFDQFKKVMPGDLLKMIIIDPNPAITKAISETLLNTFHRYCIWHILNKFYNKIHSIKNKDCDLDFKNAFGSH